jgi:cellulose synthase (UDP-forming)
MRNIPLNNILNYYCKYLYINLATKKNSFFLISFLTWGLFLIVLSHLFINVIFVYKESDLSIVDKLFSTFLILSIIFWDIHFIGYIDHFLKSFLIYGLRNGVSFHINDIDLPKVAVFIPIYNEDPEIVEKILDKTKSINYDNFGIFLLDDSTNEETHKKLAKLAASHDIYYIHRANRRGYKAGAINDAINVIENDTKYLLILDVDHCPKPNILSEVLPYLEYDHKLSFVQTPQYFISQTKDNLAIAYSFQQHIFHKHYCRGLDVDDSVFMCGTNVVIRLDHLREIGGMDETSLTEDLATSFIFHLNGYRSLYLDKVYAEGIPPLSLPAYFAQQKRWAYGTVTNFKIASKAFLEHPRRLKTSQWWNYIILNGSWYFLGLTLLLWLIYPIAVLILGIRPLTSNSYNINFLFFIMMIGSQSYTGITERGYRIKDLFLAQGLFFGLFPVYIQASICALLCKKLEFHVTPKIRTQSISIIQLCPQFLILGLLIISIIIGIERILNGQNKIPNVYAIICWAGYSAAMLILMFKFYLDDIGK